MGNISTTNIAENMETFTDIEKENYEKFNESEVIFLVGGYSRRDDKGRDWFDGTGVHGGFGEVA